MHAYLRVVAEEYGHVGGAIDLFGALDRASGDRGHVEWMQTHPLTGRRAEAACDWARSRGVLVDCPRRPLPPELAALREADDAR